MYISFKISAGVLYQFSGKKDQKENKKVGPFYLRVVPCCKSVVFQPWLQFVITWKSLYKHCCLSPSIRDSDVVDWEVRAWLLLLFKSSESEKGVWEGVSASCGLGLSATSPTHIHSRGLGLLRACQLGSERESFRENVRRPWWKLQDFLRAHLRNLTASLLSHSICQASHQGHSRCKGRGIRLHLLLVERQITFVKSM